MGTNTELLRGHVDRLLLGTLAKAPGHGYELAQRLNEASGGALTVPEGSIYPALHRLERAGLIESTWDQLDGRRRRVYSMSPSGRRQLKSWRSEWSEFSATVNRVMGVTA